MPCGKYLVVMLETWLPAMAEAGDLDQPFATAPAREQLEAMSAATVDRYLAPARARDPIRGKTTTKPSPLLRSSIKVRRAGDEVEAEPGFFEGDTVAHCGPTLKGEFDRTLNLTGLLHS